MIKPRNATDLEARFGQAVLGICQRAKTELNYDATLLLGMLADEDTVATATKPVMSDRISEGFTFLWTHERLDFTVEALVGSSEFAPLFVREVVARGTAPSRLHLGQVAGQLSCRRSAARHGFVSGRR